MDLTQEERERLEQAEAEELKNHFKEQLQMHTSRIEAEKAYRDDLFARMV